MRKLAFVGFSLWLSGCAQMGSFNSEAEPDKTVPTADKEGPVVAEKAPAPSLPGLLPEAGEGLRYRTLLRDAGHQKAAEREQTEQEADFWAAFLPQLEMKAVDHQQVHAFIRFYRTHEPYLDRVFNRGEPFLPHILSRLEEEGMPADLALLPVVESAFRPFAYSSGRAAGIWQFTPATGRHFDLKQNWWYDGRRDVLASTEAALEYLKYLHGRFDSWLLALAAYNSGPGTVNSAIRENRRRGQPTDFWNLDLPRETRSYVPKLLALSHVLRNTDRYDIDLPAIANNPGFAVVELQAPIDLARAAELGGVDVETMYRLNPGLNQWCTPPDGPNRLMVPRQAQSTFQDRLAELDPDDRVRWARHRIQSGETLSEIASAYRTTVAVLKRVNNLSGTRITAGDHLVIPTASSGEEAYALSQSQRLASIRDSGPEGRSRVQHRVAKGDSLWEIARRFNVKVRRLAKWNGMAPGDTLRAGQRLTVWVPEASTSRSTGTARVRYRVRQGDSLWTIAREFNVPMSRLRNWNDLAEEQLIHPGDKLTIYVDPTRLAEHRG
jgi:membrane-bound lytic murein transglycosylase D